MIVPVLHTISGCLIIIAIIAKISVHYYLDKQHGKSAGGASVIVTPLYYLQPYKATVGHNYRRLKKACNFLLWLALLSLLINIVCGVVIYVG